MEEQYRLAMGYYPVIVTTNGAGTSKSLQSGEVIEISHADTAVLERGI
jgi:hypothetical protein